MDYMERRKVIHKYIRTGDKRLGLAVERHFMLNDKERLEMNAAKPRTYAKENSPSTNADISLFTGPLKPINHDT